MPGMCEYGYSREASVSADRRRDAIERKKAASWEHMRQQFAARRAVTGI